MKTRFLLMTLLAFVLTLSACASATPQIVEKEVVRTVVVEKEVVVEKKVVETVVVEKEVVVEKKVVETVVVEKEIPEIPSDAKLTLWAHPSYFEGVDDFLRGRVHEFERLKGIPVEIVFIADQDFETKLRAAIEAPETLPDVISTSGLDFPTLYDAGVLMDISDVAAAVNTREGGMLPGAQAAFSVDGKQYGITGNTDTSTNYFRRDVFEAAGLSVPTTYDELLDACRKVTKPNELWCWGLNLGGWGDGEWQLQGLIFSFGGKVVESDGKTAALNSPETVAAMKWFKEMVDIGAFPPDAATADDYGNNLYYQTRQVAMITNAGSVLAWMETDDTELLEMTELAVPLEGPAGRAMAQIPHLFAVTTNTEHPDLAKFLLEWIGGPEGYWAYIEATNYGLTPSYKGLLERRVYTENEYRKPLVDTVRYSYTFGYPGPLTAAAKDIFNQKVLTNMALVIMIDNVSPEEAVANAHAQVEQILADHAE